MGSVGCNGIRLNSFRIVTLLDACIRIDKPEHRPSKVLAFGGFSLDINLLEIHSRNLNRLLHLRQQKLEAVRRTSLTPSQK